ncbi:unnamed protein product [Protopolystoma xenopodis]|uniref:Uncharacterized protein n=1 Tax=Protopolystoma xenopodis TaxID=117903 RepID=A0A3S5FCG3_9PLAT|nr:unnamed protein product [Protopolystoma xenopodis]
MLTNAAAAVLAPLASATIISIRFLKLLLIQLFIIFCPQPSPAQVCLCLSGCPFFLRLLLPRALSLSAQAKSDSRKQACLFEFGLEDQTTWGEAAKRGLGSLESWGFCNVEPTNTSDNNAGAFRPQPRDTPETREHIHMYDRTWMWMPSYLFPSLVGFVCVSADGRGNAQLAVVQARWRCLRRQEAEARGLSGERSTLKCVRVCACVLASVQPVYKACTVLGLG